MLQEADNRTWHAFYCPDALCDGRPHVATREGPACPADPYGHWWMKRTDDTFICDPENGCGATGTAIDEWVWPHARRDQRPPAWKQRWRTWAILSGRGSGKTETGSRLTHRVAEIEPNIILVAATGPDLRETMVEGVSGLLATAKPGQKPEWEPSKKKITFHNGATARGFSAEEPDRLRGPQSGFIWMDEPAHFDLIDDVWDNALFGLRLGDPSHVLVTSTPKPTKWLKKITKDRRTKVTRVATYANLYNLDPAYREFVIETYEGTRLGRQELEGETLEDVEGSLWTWEMIQRIPEAPETLDRVVVAVDPAGTANRRSDETGIIVCGVLQGHGYVLDDLSGRYSPATWARITASACEKYGADAIIAEKNYGGDMVKDVLQRSLDDADSLAPVRTVTSRRGKAIRAEPIAAQYEKERVTHVGERQQLELLEDEQTTWVPGEGPSPNRVDALVHGMTHILRTRTATTTAQASSGNLQRLPSHPSERRYR